VSPLDSEPKAGYLSPSYNGRARGLHTFLPLRQPVGGRITTTGRIANVPRTYEAVYIFDSTLEDAAISEKIARFHGMLDTTEQAEVTHWGRRQLAYSIGPRENGYYVVSKFATEPTTLPEYERALRLDDGVIRYLITLHEHEVGAPPQSEEELAAATRRDDDDDDED
jgi:small subunit ribosomal protein S6